MRLGQVGCAMIISPTVLSWNKWKNRGNRDSNGSPRNACSGSNGARSRCVGTVISGVCDFRFVFRSLPGPNRAWTLAVYVFTPRPKALPISFSVTSSCQSDIGKGRIAAPHPPLQLSGFAYVILALVRRGRAMRYAVHSSGDKL